MDWAWFNALPAALQQVLTGAAAEYAALAGPAIYAAARARLATHRAAQAQQATVQAAIQRALHDALLQTLPLLTDDPEQMRHHLDLLGDWVARPAVAGQYARLIAPAPDADLDMAILRAEFAAAGYDPDMLAQPFDAIADSIGAAFVESAAWEGGLQDVISIGVQRRVVGLLERLAPLDLDEVEQHYLNRVYGECNALPLADVEKDQRQPRLQRVFVDVRVRDAVPTYEQVMARLGLFDYRRARAGRLAQAAFSTRGDERQRAIRAPKGMATAMEGDAPWTPAVRQLDRETFDKLAEALGVSREDFRRGLENLTPLEVLAEQPAPRLVLLGDPGSGKSTLTRRWAGVLAALGQPACRHDWVEDEELAADELLRIFGRWLLPVRVVLSQWAQRLPDAAPGPSVAGAADLTDECWRTWNRTANLPGDAAKQHFLARFMGHAPTVLLLLDGLDEVTDPARRQSALQAITGFAVTYPHVPVIVTSRVRPYAALRRAGESLDWPTATLDTLTEDAIAHFVDRWHTELVAAHAWEGRLAADRQRHFTTALAEPRREELRVMAGTPLLLTMMVKVNYKERLPDSRAELYEAFVKQLLFEWERKRQGDGGEETALDRLLAEAHIPPDQFAYRLNALAFAIHDGANRDTVDIPADRLRRTLMALYLDDLEEDEDPHAYPNPVKAGQAFTWARQVMDFIADRTGLINWEDNGVYRFSHRSFQEYLAARWMANHPDFIERFAERIRDEDWRETVLLAIGYQCKVRGAPYHQPVQVINEFWPDALDGPQTVYLALLLGEAFVYQLGLQRLGGGGAARRLKTRVIDDLTALMQQPGLTAYLNDAKSQARTRLTAGLLLADLDVLPPDLEELVAIPGANFRIGKYPATNYQYRRFVDDGGYQPAAEGGRNRWWSEEGWKWRERYDWTKPRFWDDRELNCSTQPVVGVNWYEAEAYCAWLTARWRADGVITDNELVRRPTRAEWEQAARHGAPPPADDATDYPWRGPFEASRANTNESGLEQTTPVHMYRHGQTADHVWDMAGNVWEWTCDLYRRDSDGDARYWFKGGAYYSDADSVRASAAGRRRAGRRDYYRGCRVVVVPISRS
jgi:hypothetical protein